MFQLIDYVCISRPIEKQLIIKDLREIISISNNYFLPPSVIEVFFLLARALKR